MAGKDMRGPGEVGKIGKDTGGAGKMGRSKGEEKQRKLVTEGREGEKKVTFKFGKEISEKEEWDKLKQEIKVIKEEIERMREERKIYREAVNEIKVKIRDYEKKLAEQEERIEELENREKGREFRGEVESGGGRNEKEGRILIGEDFNIRTGELGGSCEEGDFERFSKDKVIGNGGKEFIEWVEERGWKILNGKTEGDWEGEYTYVCARGSTVIDYVIVNEESENCIKKFKIGERVDSDHLPLEVEIRMEEEESREEGKISEDEEEEEEMEVIIWNKEVIKSYNEQTKEWSGEERIDEQEANSVEYRWEEIKQVVYGAMVRKKVRKRKRELGHKDWWDRSCTKKKREKRGKRMNIENNVGKEEWRSYFKALLEGLELEEKVTKEKDNDKEEAVGDGEEEEIKEVVVWRAIKGMKKKKAAGIDGIPMDLCRRRSEEKVNGFNKIDMESRDHPNRLEEKLEVEVAIKELLPKGQAGFRAGRSTLDNIFVLLHLMQRERRKGGKNEKVYMMFADLKAAFDNVDRNKLWKELRGRGIEEDLVKRIEKIYEETEVVVRTKQGFTKAFKTKKGVRQGCILSPLLFNLYTARIEKEMKKRRISGVKIGNCRIWSLTYADDVVILANNREAMQDMMGTIKKFVKERNLDLSVNKTKMLVFNRKKKEKYEKWSWEGKTIEEKPQVHTATTAIKDSEEAGNSFSSSEDEGVTKEKTTRAAREYRVTQMSGKPRISTGLDLVTLPMQEARKGKVSLLVDTGATLTLMKLKYVKDDTPLREDRMISNGSNRSQNSNYW
ncbi:PREDICTED: uncharacterized protein LOC105448076 [Wasmannia auropunctata]|uniref:uncharacterized protein LOC105448076 n=1 Tax=Wasmannia auropunctata TaxID=64793 RepID=UPI0005EF75F8|nr:PREDICTED: uncharacterized protein LOC105448076 [Wasmannia auropunctata]